MKSLPIGLKRTRRHFGSQNVNRASKRREGLRPTWRSCRSWCEAPLIVLMRGLPTSSAQWLWSQFTLADHAFVWLSKALYLILKFAVVHRQSFDDDIRSLPHIQACRKQTRANLEFVHNGPPRCHFTLQIGASPRRLLLGVAALCQFLNNSQTGGSKIM